MKLISSKATFFQKRVFPVIWFGLLGLFVVSFLPGAVSKGDVPVPVFFIPVFMAAVGYFIFNRLIFDLADEVFDLGDSLLVKKGGREAVIRLSNIMKVSASGFQNPPRLTLALREPCVFGKEVAFMAPCRFSMNPFSQSPLAMELTGRIDAGRRRDL